MKWKNNKKQMDGKEMKTNRRQQKKMQNPGVSTDYTPFSEVSCFSGSLSVEA